MVPLLAGGIPSQGVFSSELRGNGPLFVGVVDGPLGLEGVEKGAEEHRVVVFGAEPLNRVMLTPL